ncbi:unnamed protein product [Owenia fusiformis]|uniref:Uncharacterized protein n=1 Tax=Owenia fusiformis TaxID=6347 RepID=A0A8J1XT88_OWEFU|nr:unnamed protein product [Owenia fusiformis]
MTGMIQLVFLLSLFECVLMQVLDISPEMMQDINCDTPGFSRVGAMMLSMKDCVFIVCDPGNPDARRRKFAMGCSETEQVDTNKLKENEIFYPFYCLKRENRLAIRSPLDCLAIRRKQICKRKENTNINCGPTYDDLKGNTNDGLSNDDVIFGDPHIWQKVAGGEDGPGETLCYDISGKGSFTYRLLSVKQPAIDVDITLTTTADGSDSKLIEAVTVETAFEIIRASKDEHGSLLYTVTNKGDEISAAHGISEDEKTVVIAVERFHVKLKCARTYIVVEVSDVTKLGEIGGIMGDISESIKSLDNGELILKDGSMLNAVKSKWVAFTISDHEEHHYECWKVENIVPDMEKYEQAP